MATAADIAAIITEIQAGADTILQTLSAVDPALSLETGTAEGITDLIAVLASKALAAWSASSGTPITVESVQALYANSTPLTAPTEGI